MLKLPHPPSRSTPLIGRRILHVIGQSVRVLIGCWMLSALATSHRAILTNHGLQFLNEVVVGILNERLQGEIDIPEIRLTRENKRLSLKNFRTSSSRDMRSELVSRYETGLEWNLEFDRLLLTTSWTADWRNTLLSLVDDGEAEIEVINAKIQIHVSVFYRPNGVVELKAFVANCDARFENLGVEFQGGLSWLYNLFSSQVSRMLRFELPPSLCQLVSSVISNFQETRLDMDRHRRAFSMGGMSFQSEFYLRDSPDFFPNRVVFPLSVDVRLFTRGMDTEKRSYPTSDGNFESRVGNRQNDIGVRANRADWHIQLKLSKKYIEDVLTEVFVGKQERSTWASISGSFRVVCNGTDASTANTGASSLCVGNAWPALRRGDALYANRRVAPKVEILATEIETSLATATGNKMAAEKGAWLRANATVAWTLKGSRRDNNSSLIPVKILTTNHVIRFTFDAGFDPVTFGLAIRFRVGGVDVDETQITECFVGDAEDIVVERLEDLLEAVFEMEIVHKLNEIFVGKTIPLPRLATTNSTENLRVKFWDFSLANNEIDLKIEWIEEKKDSN